jgi:hypothetical protein
VSSSTRKAVHHEQGKVAAPSQRPESDRAIAVADIRWP